jgi:predicted nucleic-acid-binding Zn-ribbon protein
LTKIKGGGEVRCPKCGVKISPDDETENTYTILETVMKRDRLDKIALQCNKCQSQIYLTGFLLLDTKRH